MSARIPVQHKSPFEIDPRPLDEMASPNAGLLATSRALRSLKIPDLIAANLQLKKRDRGCSDGQLRIPTHFGQQSDFNRTVIRSISDSCPI